MQRTKLISVSTLVASLVFVTGCTTQSTTYANTSNDNTNTVVTNSNENTNQVVNENTNTDQGSEVDTSDWLTYTNEEYGFSLKYPVGYTVNGNPQAGLSINSSDILVTNDSCVIKISQKNSNILSDIKNTGKVNGEYEAVPYSGNFLSGYQYYGVTNENGDENNIYILATSKSIFTVLLFSGKAEVCNNELNLILDTIQSI